MLDDLSKNKYATLQKAFIRKFCEAELYSNQQLREAIKNKFRIKEYFNLSAINKFGVLTVTDPQRHLIKFVSVGIPDKILESISVDF